MFEPEDPELPTLFDGLRLAPFDSQRYNSLDFNAVDSSFIPECVRSKTYNRFMDVLPNPNTRVTLPQLPGDPTSLYINANFVRGFDGDPNTYIAAMGPLPATINNFWRMVWENNVTCIVMATGLLEGGKQKCERYWPEEFSEQQYAGLRVEWMAAEKKPGYLLTKLEVKLGSEVRTVQHFWYNTWPDHGVPHKDGKAFPDHIIGLLRELSTIQLAQETKSPIVIHCSAGIGRTGAIIAIDHCLRHLRTVRVVDPVFVVYTIRKDRCALVQHLNQYELVYEACQRYSEMVNLTLEHSIEVRGNNAKFYKQLQELVVKHQQERAEKAREEALAAARDQQQQQQQQRANEAKERKAREDALAAARERLAREAAAAEEANRKSMLMDKGGSTISFDILAGSTADEDDEDEDDKDTLKELQNATRRVAHLEMPWFHGVLTREESEDLFVDYMHREGTFLIRESATNPGQYVCSLTCKEKIYHNRITYQDGMFCTKGQQFDTLNALVDYYKTPRPDCQTPLKEALPVSRDRAYTEGSLNDRAFALMALPANDASRATLPAVLARIETRKCGWLTKQGGGNAATGTWSLSTKTGGLFARKNWKRRWFILQDTMIKYYKSEYAGPETALGYINLGPKCSVVQQTERFFDLVTPKRTYSLHTDKPEEALEWVQVLRSALEKLKTAPQ